MRRRSAAALSSTHRFQDVHYRRGMGFHLTADEDHPVAGDRVFFGAQQ